MVHYHPLQPPESEIITICSSHINFFSFSHFSLPITIQAKHKSPLFSCSPFFVSGKSKRKRAANYPTNRKAGPSILTRSKKRQQRYKCEIQTTMQCQIELNKLYASLSSSNRSDLSGQKVVVCGRGCYFHCLPPSCLFLLSTNTTHTRAYSNCWATLERVVQKREVEIYCDLVDLNIESGGDNIGRWIARNVTSRVREIHSGSLVIHISIDWMAIEEDSRLGVLCGKSDSFMVCLTR